MLFDLTLHYGDDTESSVVCGYVHCNKTEMQFPTRAGSNVFYLNKLRGYTLRGSSAYEEFPELREFEKTNQAYLKAKEVTDLETCFYLSANRLSELVGKTGKLKGEGKVDLTLFY